MTLISVMTNNGFPVVVSDRVVSKTGPVEPLTLPSRNSIIDFNQCDSKRQPYTLVQKTTIIQDVLCVGFAGVIADIRQAHQDIHDFFLYRPVNEESVCQLFAEYDFAQYNGSAFVFLLAEPKGKSGVKVNFIGNWDHFDHRLTGPWSNAGSGSRVWNELFEYFADFVECTEPFAISTIIEAVVYPCIVKSLADEKRGSDNLLDGWGGGFDVIYYHDGKFCRLSDTTYVFWQMGFGKSSELQLHSIIHEHYDDRKLIFRNYSGADIDIYQINELNHVYSAVEEYDIHFESKKVISIISIMNGENHLGDRFVSGDMENDEVVLTCGEYDGRLCTGFSKAYSARLNQAVSESFEPDNCNP